MKAFILALQFLTRLPTPALTQVAAEDVGRSALFYPLVGLLMGAILALCAWLIQGLDTSVAAVLLLILWVWLSGALHLDGLADSADAWLGGQGDRERTLEIMKDPRCGPVGVCALVLLLLCKYTALAALLEAGVQAEALLLLPMLGRAAALALFANTAYVRAEGLGSALADHLPRQHVPLVLLACGLLSLLLLGWLALAVIVVGLAGFTWLRHLMNQRIQGTTGDTAGAMIELLEGLLLVAWVGLFI